MLFMTLTSHTPGELTTEKILAFVHSFFDGERAISDTKICILVRTARVSRLIWSDADVVNRCRKIRLASCSCFLTSRAGSRPCSTCTVVRSRYVTTERAEHAMCVTRRLYTSNVTLQRHAISLIAHSSRAQRPSFSYRPQSTTRQRMPST
jgi:hypothetical protein